MRTNSGTLTGHGSSSGTNTLDVNERTRLLANGDGAAAHSDQKGFWHQVFLDPKKTPGLDSPKAWVRWPVHVFNVIKLVLLSSTSPVITRQPPRARNLSIHTGAVNMIC